MILPVILRDRAEDQLEANYQWLVKNYSEAYATEWYNGFLDALMSLECNPERCPIAEESSLVAYELRELHFGTGRKATHRGMALTFH
jgi:hypothetical protein